ncbi:alpha/beta hydrolase [Leptospira johnsonii]|uniref:Putative 4-hydroxyacetophenone monooxygenase n=1 Tax=Leptospira johnsonii TaxID=1917820 RepID=A0A2P2D226_9LEPT|nr:alpha/beta hydrolase [Leptospira johnsonii]GBF38688.1 putative 4-hydroxyacetophenone monooxygenase [Leptospira johnsonii]
MEFAPEMLEYANLISSKGLTGFTQGSIQERRDGYSAIGELLGEGPLMREIQETSIPSQGGNVFIKSYIPKTEPKSKILYFHGGGWVVGRLRDFDPFARKLAEITSSIVSLVEYRLAPEFPFPLPLEDSYAALEWISSQKETIWKNLPLVVAGDSAGGNLAASTIMRAKETSGPKIDLQILIYPVTEAVCDTESYKEFELGPGLTKKDMEWFIAQYLPNPNTRSDHQASPLYQKDWKGLPPAIVFIADIDPLRDDGKLYAEKLKEAGVSVLFKEFQGYTHGFFTKVNLLKAPEEGLRMISEEMDRVFKRKEVLL